jgi:hypothetical protein
MSVSHRYCGTDLVSTKTILACAHYGWERGADPDILALLDRIMTDAMQQHDINDSTNPPIVPPVETVGAPVRVLQWGWERAIDDAIATRTHGPYGMA